MFALCAITTYSAAHAESMDAKALLRMLERIALSADLRDIVYSEEILRTRFVPKVQWNVGPERFVIGISYSPEGDFFLLKETFHYGQTIEQGSSYFRGKPVLAFMSFGQHE